MYLICTWGGWSLSTAWMISLPWCHWICFLLHVVVVVFYTWNDSAVVSTRLVNTQNTMMRTGIKGSLSKAPHQSFDQACNSIHLMHEIFITPFWTTVGFYSGSLDTWNFPRTSFEVFPILYANITHLDYPQRVLQNVKEGAIFLDPPVF